MQHTVDALLTFSTCQTANVDPWGTTPLERRLITLRSILVIKIEQERWRMVNPRLAEMRDWHFKIRARDEKV